MTDAPLHRWIIRRPGRAPTVRPEARTAVLHIGVERTGTTSLQRFLWSSRAALRERGCHYSMSLSPAGDGNHTLLGAAFLAPRHRSFVPEEYRRRTRERLIEGLRAELVGIEGGLVVLSNEHLHSRLVDPHRCVALVEALRGLGFETIRLVVYLRRQDQLLDSAYRSAVRSGDVPVAGVIMRELRRRRGWYTYGDYAALLERWAAVIPTEHTTVRIYDRARLVGGSIEADFLEAIGLGGAGLVREPGEHGRSWSAETTNYLRHLNGTSTELARPDDDAREKLIAALEAHPDVGGRYVFTPAQRAAIRDAFAESNAAVAQRFFPGAAELFEATPPDEGEGASVVDVRRFAEITAHLLDRLLR